MIKPIRSKDRLGSAIPFSSVTINPNGRVASVTDEKGMPIPKISVNQDNHIGDLLAKFPTKKAKKRGSEDDSRFWCQSRMRVLLPGASVLV